MKKLLLTISAVALSAVTYAQVIAAGISPQSIVANYTHTWADPASGWGTPDFNIPETYVQDTLMLANDGTPGLNAQGNPVSASGCNSLAAGSLAGKIAVVYRGDGTTNTTSGGCEFGLKALNAQNAGAVGVIVINRNPNEVVAMGAGLSGANVNIPVVMLDLNDGATLTTAMANGPVVMFLGNKAGLFPTDIALNANSALAPKGGMVHTLLAQNGNEFNFEIGAKVTNPGSFPKTNVQLNAKVLNPSGVVVYDNTTSGLSFNAIDTTGIEVYPGEINSLPSFSLNSYPVGTYTLKYTALFDSSTYYAISLLNGGEGYDSETNVATAGGSGNGLTVVYNSSPIITAVLGLNNLSPGQGYIDSTGVTTTGGEGNGLTLDIDAEIIGQALQIVSQISGSNYTDSLNVSTNSLTGDGIGLTVGYTTLNGAIDSVFIINGGSGYEINDTVQIYAGDSTATITIDSVTIGQILSFTINNAGQGYMIGDTITIDSGSNGSVIVSQISTSGGTITSVTAFDMGQGYSIGDTLQITGGNDALIVIDSILTILPEDLDSSDNSLTFTFTINDSIFSYSEIDPVTNQIGASNFYRPTGTTQLYSICTVLNDPNANRVAATGLYFASTTAANTVPLDGEEMGLYLYTWDNQFTDLDDANFPANNAWTLTEVASGFYNYPSDLQGEVVYGSFTSPVILQNNTRYLACVQTVNPNLYLGFGSQNYTWNTDYYLQPMFPIQNGASYFAVGFGTDLPSTLGIALIDKNNIGLSEENVVAGKVFPNPATDIVTMAIEGEGTAYLTVTDIAGKVAMTTTLNLVAGQDNVNISALETGLYIFNVTLENGKTAQFNVVKK